MKRFFVVIHIQDILQVMKNVQIAVDAKADGVFLIHHTRKFTTLLEIAEAVHQKYPDLWIGINMLDLPTGKAFTKVPAWVQGLWCDDGGIEENEDGTFDSLRAELYDRVRINSGWRGEYFGGFAFKYQKPVKNLLQGANIAAHFMDVVTTSGDGTGIAAELDKIKKIYEGAFLRAHIGIASGITPDNIEQYLPWVDDFLVATGISSDCFNLDPSKVALLRSKIQ